MRDAVIAWATEADRAGLRADSDLERTINRVPERMDGIVAKRRTGAAEAAKAVGTRAAPRKRQSRC